MKCVTKKRSISFLIIILFITGMCFDIPRAESFFEYTDKGKNEIISISDTISQCRDICTDELLRIDENESYIVQGIIQSIRLNARQSHRTRFLTGYIKDLTYNFAYMTYVSLKILLSGIIFFSITVIMYIHAKDGEKQNNTL